MVSPLDPLRLEYSNALPPLQLVHQLAPAGAATFAATFVGPAGWARDPDRREGTARLVAQLLPTAAGALRRVALARRLDRIGATLTSRSSPESGEVTVWGSEADRKKLLGLLAEAVLRPRFDPDDIERIRRSLSERQLREIRQPAGRADRELLAAVFPRAHPYRSTGLGTRASLDRISRSDLIRFHRRHYVADGGLLVVTTGSRSDRVERDARRVFRGLSDRGPDPLVVPALPRRAPRNVRVHLPGRAQVEVRVGGPSITQDSPRYPAAYLANQLLGGRPLLNRLFQRVRERGGLAYGTSSHLETMRWGGFWTASAGTGPERWPTVVRMLEREIDRVRDRPVPGPELDVIRESAIGEIPLSLEETSDAHELAVDAAYHGMPADFWLTWPARLRAVRPREVREAAELAFDRNASATVVAGPLRRA